MRPAGSGGRKARPPVKAPVSAPTSAPAPADPSAYYTQLLQQDPGFLALQQSLSAADQQNAAVRDQGIAQALVQYGMIPDFSQLSSLGLSPDALSAIQAAITPQIRALAQQNTANGLSTQAQLQQQEQQAMLGLRNNLAARGALSSGDDAYRTGLQEHAYALAQNKALQSLLGFLGGQQQTYLTNHQQGQQQLAQAIPGIVNNLVGEYPAGPSMQNVPAPHVSSGGAAGGGGSALNPIFYTK